MTINKKITTSEVHYIALQKLPSTALLPNCLFLWYFRSAIFTPSPPSQEGCPSSFPTAAPVLVVLTQFSFHSCNTLHLAHTPFGDSLIPQTQPGTAGKPLDVGKELSPLLNDYMISVKLLNLLCDSVYPCVQAILFLCFACKFLFKTGHSN